MDHIARDLVAMGIAEEEDIKECLTLWGERNALAVAL